MKYLVFGGTGYLGSHLVDLLISEGHKVVIFDNHSGNVISNFAGPTEVIKGDITKLADLHLLDRFDGFDGVFHLAAKKSVPESFSKPHLYLRVNEIGTLNIIQYCVERGLKKFVFTSSAAVYGEVDSQIPIHEEYPASPINPYGLSKLHAEYTLTSQCLSGDISAISLRTFNIVGAKRVEYFDSVGENVLPVIARKLNMNRLFTVFGNGYATLDGTCVRDYVNVRDVANAHMLSMNYLHTGTTTLHKIVNISSMKGISILELITKVNDFSDKRLAWNFGEARAGDPAQVIGDNNRAKKLLGWSPIVGIDESIRETLGIF